MRCNNHDDHDDDDGFEWNASNAYIHEYENEGQDIIKKRKQTMQRQPLRSKYQMNVSGKTTT